MVVLRVRDWDSENRELCGESGMVTRRFEYGTTAMWVPVHAEEAQVPRTPRTGTKVLVLNGSTGCSYARMLLRARNAMSGTDAVRPASTEGLVACPVLPSVWLALRSTTVMYSITSALRHVRY
eukprot:1572127-Rhodomonas_salina.1